MRMTRKNVLAVLLGAAFGASAQAAPIDCRAAHDNVEKAICAAPPLLATDASLSRTFAARVAQCPEAQRSLLRQTQHFWLRDRNNCANIVEEGEGALKQCVADRMAERIAQFERIGASCKLDTVAGEYRFVDPGYLARFAGRYEGKTVAVSGSLRLDSCSNAKSPRLTGKLRPRSGKGAGFPVRFQAMSDLQRERLCNQQPSAHWRGIVRGDGGRFYLYLSDILGEPV